MKILSTPVLVLLLSSTSRAFASTLRGGSDVDSPFTCSLSAFDEDSCTSSKDDSGTACVWCSLSGAGGAGICVSKDQYDAMGGICSADDDDAPSPDDDAVVTDDDAPAPDDDDKAPDDDTTPAPDDDFWDCLKSMDKAHCSCTWCIAKPGFGICLNDEAVKDAEGSDWFNCSGAVEDDHENAMNPLDPQCLAAGMGSDDAQSVCDATLDSDGTPCVWCDVAGGYGLCLSSDAADTAGQFLTCDKSGEGTAVKSPVDPTCIVAGFNGDDAEGTCHDTQDMDGTACVWCEGPSPNMGVCLSSDQADLASQWLTCNKSVDLDIE